MCFSAPASFIASGGLAVLGGASLASAKKEDKIIAAIPILFGIQQASEGVQWLYLNSGSVSLTAGYVFLFFAFILWPIYVPSFVFILDRKKRRVLKWFITLGAAVAAYFFYALLTEPLTISKINECVGYSFNFPSAVRDIVDFGYLLAVFAPLIISSNKVFNRFGVAVAVLALIAWIFFAETFLSVWCFFAAIVSAMFFVYIKMKNDAAKV